VERAFPRPPDEARHERSTMLSLALVGQAVLESGHAE
jgi:hypothetical protein